MSLQSFITVELRSELYDYSVIQNNRVIAAIGSSSAWDIPTEIWTFDSSSMAVDNGTTVIRPTEISVGGAGRFLFRTYFIRQSGTKYSKEFKVMATTSANNYVFDISSASFSSIVDFDCKAFLSGSGVSTAPIAIVTSKSLTSFTVSLFESKTTAVLIGGNVEGLEPHAVAGTEVYLTVQGN